MSATQEIAVSGLAWTGYLPEQDFATFAKAAGLNGDGSLPEADPDHDGRSSFAEFAFGGNPAAADTPPAAPRPVIAARTGIRAGLALRKPGLSHSLVSGFPHKFPALNWFRFSVQAPYRTDILGCPPAPL